MLTILIILVSLCGVCYSYLTKNFDYWKKRNVIGPKPVIFKGNFPSVWNQKVHQAYEFEKIYNDYKGQPFVGIYTITAPKLMVLDPELIKKVLVQDFKKFQDNEFSDFVDKKSDPLMGRNPFVLQGNEWKEKRAEVTPGFTISRIRGLHGMMGDVCRKMTKYLKEKSSENVKTFDTKELMSKYAADVVSMNGFAYDAKSFEEEKPEMREMCNRLFKLSIKFFLYVATVSLFPFIKYVFKVAIVPNVVNEYFLGMMDKAITHRKENKIECNDFLDHLLKLEGKKGVKLIDLAAQAVTLFSDGFETTSLAMTYALYDIAKNKDVQDRLRADIRDLKETNEEITYDDLSQLTYLEQILNESLRLHPLLPVVTKKCTETTELTDGNTKVLIEKGISVVIPMGSIHFDAEYYPDPLKFDPDRFSPDNGGIKPYKDKGVYLPFADGPRMCLGMKFALAAMKRGLVEIVQNFEISVNIKTRDPIRFDPDQFLMLPIGGMWLDFKPINY